jgi:hypothetical protein
MNDDDTKLTFRLSKMRAATLLSPAPKAELD